HRGGPPMTEEQAFLDALKANPADDTTRLVYADWLDDHGESAKAEYLRLVAALCRSSPPVDPQSAIAEQLREAETRLPAGWRDTTGRPFDLVIVEIRPERKISAIKTIRELFVIGLAAAKLVSESLPAGVMRSACLTEISQL